MADLLEAPRGHIETQTGEPDPAASPRRKIILLSGEWRAPLSHFSFEATIFVAANGAAAGDFFYINRGTPGCAPDFSGVELVRGSAGPARLELAGYQADPGLACDQYKISLTGAPDAGVCTGITYGHGDWKGRLEGAYRIVEQPD